MKLFRFNKKNYMATYQLKINGKSLQAEVNLDFKR